MITNVSMKCLGLKDVNCVKRKRTLWCTGLEVWFVQSVTTCRDQTRRQF